ncbi:MAG: hypothetical protein RMZ43_009800 [Nostoc sp. CmiVER01]|uniref:hypothetical protein n=1 Tax=Nostoc sp. CmiVER01 TaxID=3075384 RepID=UPI002AD8BA3A|nr:hypothetical protein [Nostoc sp. CmiVER01]
MRISEVRANWEQRDFVMSDFKLAIASVHSDEYFRSLVNGTLTPQSLIHLGRGFLLERSLQLVLFSLVS